jgi:hypothetical protein
MQKREENRNLIATFMEAVNLAMAEKRAAGHACLLAGLRRAEALRASGEKWGADLVRRWRQALRFYMSRYGVFTAPGQAGSSRAASKNGGNGQGRLAA